MRESVIENHLVKRVKELRGEIRKVKWIQRNGAPDRCVWIPGWRWPKWPEMKSPGKKLDPHQVREHTRLKAMGFDVCKLDTIADVNKFLR